MLVCRSVWNAGQLGNRVRHHERLLIGEIGVVHARSLSLVDVGERDLATEPWHIWAHLAQPPSHCFTTDPANLVSPVGELCHHAHGCGDEDELDGHPKGSYKAMAYVGPY